MTAESSKSNGPLREPEPGGSKTPVPGGSKALEPGGSKTPVPEGSKALEPGGSKAPSRRRRRRLRRKPRPEGQAKGQLRMRSPSGAFVVVGISVVLVGMTIAVVGYWPHRGAAGTGAGAGNTSTAGDLRREVAAGRSHVPHGEKLKLIGPVIMGIGLFIFICANTMLYENRDMETRRLMQKGFYSMAGGGPEGTGPEDGHCQHGDSQAVPKANAECVEGCYQVDLSCQPCPSPSSKWSNVYGPNRLQTTAEFLQQPAASPAASLLSLRSGASAEANLSFSCHAGADSLLSSAVGALALPAPVSTGSSMPLGQDHGAGGGHIIINMVAGCPSTELAAAELSLDAQLHMPGHSKSLDLGRPGLLLVAPIQERRNRSWPRLDHGSLLAYAKLESTGESSDEL
ncbi:T200B protein, partial [Bucco capensis]|nr:T200B protein [Bucco capensis]